MVGQNIGKYRVLERVGRGGMGTVYRAIDETLHREVAIKVLNAELNDPEVAKRFRAEAITVARLSHPGIATIYELFQHEGQWLMVMEFVRGETLEHMVDRMGALSPQRAAELCMQALAALAHAHSMGVVHRDLKPANIMITEIGAIKIMDFGIARVSGTEHLTNVGFMMGTPSYMAPEQVMGREIDARADLYAMGVVFYRLTSGKLPFKGDTPFAMAQSQVNDPPMPIGAFRADLPPWVEQVVVRALAKSPEERFQSAVEFHEGFARCLAGLPMQTSYNSSAPTEMMMTPARAMSTGSIRTMGSIPLPVSHTPPAQPTAAPAGSTPAGTPAPQPGAGHTPAAAPSYTPGAAPVAPTPASTAMASDEFAQTIQTATPVGLPAALPPPAPTSSAPVIAAPGPATGAAPVAGAPVAGAPAAGAPKAAPASSAKKGGSGAIAAVAAIVVVAGIGGAVWYRSHHAAASPEATSAPAAATTPPAPAPPPAPDQSATPAAPAPAAPAAAPPAPVTAPAPPAAGASAAPKPARATSAPADVAAGAMDASSSSTSSTRGSSAAPPGSPPTTAARGAAALSTAAGRGAATDDSHQAFSNVKVLAISNRNKTEDQDIVLSFVGGQVTALSAKGLSLDFADGHVAATRADSPNSASLPYKSILAATYVHARDPKWNTDDFSPPNDLDVGGMLRGSKHFLVLQTKDSYLILKLEDENVLRVLAAVESHTGLKVDRPQDKPQTDGSKPQ